MSKVDTTFVSGAAVGTCRTCGNAPVAFAAPACPHCGARNPNPGVADRFAGRGMLIGVLAGFVLGGLGGYFSQAVGSPVMAIAGALVGAIAGLIVGLVVGLMLAMIAWIAGKR
jgi:hypothetical protein